MNPLYTVHLKGSQAEMGAQYGRFVLEHGVITEGEWALTTLAWRMLQDVNSHSVAGRLTNLGVKGLMHYGVSRMQKHRPQPYLDRTLAFMDALGRPRSTAGHMLLMDMFQNIVGLAGRYRVGPFARAAQALATPACSSLATWGQASADGQIRHARNFDFPVIGTWDAYPTVVHCEPEQGLRYGYVGSFGADVPGTTGFNEAGMTVAAHTRLHRDINFNAGSIVDLCHDLIARAESLDDAIKIARELPVSCAWGLLVTSAREQRAICLETTGAGVEVVEARQGAQYLTATNLHRHPEMTSGLLEPFPAWTEHADSREKRLEAEGRRGGLDRQELMDLLGDRGADCRRAGGICAQAISVTSVVMEPEQQKMALSVGETPTGWGPYVEVEWDWDQPVGWQKADDLEAISPRREPGDGPVRQAYGLWRQGVRAAYERHDPEEQLPLLEQAAQLDGEAPSYRLMAGILRLRQGDWTAALNHFEAGRYCEQTPFRRGQFLLWGARCLDQLGRSDDACRWREELLGLRGAHVESLQELARDEQDRVLPARRLRKLTYSLDLVDAQA